MSSSSSSSRSYSLLSCEYCDDFPMYSIPNGKLACFAHRKLDGRPLLDLTEELEEEAHDTEFCLCIKCTRNIYLEEESVGNDKKKRKKGNVMCVLCHTRRVGGGKCSSDHHLCISCTKNYVEKTLMTKGTVFWDRIPCLSDECSSKYMQGLSVQNILSKKTKTTIDKQQWDVSHLICGERDPGSQKAVEKFTKPCPNCSVPVQKKGGCDHMTCTMCKFNYFWTCKCPYPHHNDECQKNSN